jgi:hypothetical protein
MGMPAFGLTVAYDAFTPSRIAWKGDTKIIEK